MFISCTGAVKKVPGERIKQGIPEVTGNVQLTFSGIFGIDTGITSPWGMSFGSDGTLYVCDRDGASIVRLDSDGKVLSRFDGTGLRTGRLFTPIDVCTTGGLGVYAIDAAKSRVLKFDRNLKNAFSIYSKESESNRLFGTFNGLAFDNTTGDLFITDRDTGAIIRLDMLGGSIHSMGAFGDGKNNFRIPAGIDVADDGTLYIADRGYGAVAVVRTFGSAIRYIGKDSLDSPIDVAVLPGGYVVAADLSGVVIISVAGVPEGYAGYDVDRNMTPRSVAYRDGKIYIGDGVSGSILVYRVDFPPSEK